MMFKFIMLMRRLLSGNDLSKTSFLLQTYYKENKEVIKANLDKETANSIVDLIVKKIHKGENYCKDLSYQNKYIYFLINVAEIYYKDEQYVFWQHLIDCVGVKNVSEGIAYKLKNGKNNDAAKAVMLSKRLNVLDSLDNVEQGSVRSIEEKIKSLLNVCEPEDKVMLNDILNKQLPDIIGGYIKIDKDFRDKLKDEHGLSAKQLFAENLDNIRDLLSEVQEGINVRHLQELSKKTKINKKTFRINES